MNTVIDNVINKVDMSTDVIENVDIPDSDLETSIMDLSLDNSIRIKSFDRYYNVFGKEKLMDIISKLNVMFLYSNLSELKRYFVNICLYTTIPIVFKVQIINILLNNTTDDSGYNLVKLLWNPINESDEIPLPCKIDLLFTYMRNDTYLEDAVVFFNQITNDNRIDCDFRYKTILSIEHRIEPKKLAMIYIKKLCFLFIDNNKNQTSYRILACQILLRQKIKADKVKHVETLLLSFANDVQLDYNLRADATDVLLHVGTNESKLLAREIIDNLGFDQRRVNTVFNNAQNVHVKEIEESARDILENIKQIKQDETISFSSVEKYVLDTLKEERKNLNLKESEPYPRETLIKASLNRIVMDRALYGSFTLSNVLISVWNYIIVNEHKNEMIIRLMEELSEMSGTCSTGYINRLLNVFSGFGELNLKISWRDQIISNLSGRLNAKIRELDDIALRDNVLYELTLDTQSFDTRINFLNFFRSVILSIRDEMYIEFKEYITDTDFDLYFRHAISQYESPDYA